MKRVLVVDDSSVMRKGVSRMLTARGWECDTAVDGVDALEKIRSGGQEYDLVCTDVHMPNMDGIELVKAVREIEEFKHLTLLVVSSDSDRRSIARALMAGADEYATKPMSEEALDDKLALMGL